MANEKFTLLKHLQLTAMRCSAMVTSKISELTTAVSQDIEELDNAKQDKLTFDTTPKSGSTNPVTSGGVYSALSGKLEKTTYEYNKELTLGSTGKVCIGKFPMYDSNISVEIKSTTNTTYNGTLIIATQNINTTGGGTYTATVYGDVNNSLTNAIKIHYGSGSNVFSVYINLPGWSKNLLHIQCVALTGTPTDIATTVSEIPSNATIVPTNAIVTKIDSAITTAIGSINTLLDEINGEVV